MKTGHLFVLNVIETYVMIKQNTGFLIKRIQYGEIAILKSSKKDLS
jgi:hypothetical protein